MYKMQKYGLYDSPSFVCDSDNSTSGEDSDEPSKRSRKVSLSSEPKFDIKPRRIFGRTNNDNKGNLLQEYMMKIKHPQVTSTPLNETSPVYPNSSLKLTPIPKNRNSIISGHFVNYKKKVSSNTRKSLNNSSLKIIINQINKLSKSKRKQLIRKTINKPKGEQTSLKENSLEGIVPLDEISNSSIQCKIDKELITEKQYPTTDSVAKTNEIVESKKELHNKILEQSATNVNKSKPRNSLLDEKWLNEVLSDLDQSVLMHPSVISVSSTFGSRDAIPITNSVENVNKNQTSNGLKPLSVKLEILSDRKLRSASRLNNAETLLEASNVITKRRNINSNVKIKTKGAEIEEKKISETHAVNNSISCRRITRANSHLSMLEDQNNISEVHKSTDRKKPTDVKITEKKNMHQSDIQKSPNQSLNNVSTNTSTFIENKLIGSENKRLSTCKNAEVQPRSRRVTTETKVTDKPNFVNKKMNKRGNGHLPMLDSIIENEVGTDKNAVVNNSKRFKSFVTNNSQTIPSVEQNNYLGNVEPKELHDKNSEENTNIIATTKMKPKTRNTTTKSKICDMTNNSKEKDITIIETQNEINESAIQFNSVVNNSKRLKSFATNNSQTIPSVEQNNHLGNVELKEQLHDKNSEENTNIIATTKMKPKTRNRTTKSKICDMTINSKEKDIAIIETQNQINESAKQFNGDISGNVPAHVENNVIDSFSVQCTVSPNKPTKEPSDSSAIILQNKEKDKLIVKPRTSQRTKSNKNVLTSTTLTQVDEIVKDFDEINILTSKQTKEEKNEVHEQLQDVNTLITESYEPPKENVSVVKKDSKFDNENEKPEGSVSNYRRKKQAIADQEVTLPDSAEEKEFSKPETITSSNKRKTKKKYSKNEYIVDQETDSSQTHDNLTFVNSDCRIRGNGRLRRNIKPPEMYIQATFCHSTVLKRPSRRLTSAKKMKSTSKSSSKTQANNNTRKTKNLEAVQSNADTLPVTTILTNGIDEHTMLSNVSESIKSTDECFKKPRGRAKRKPKTGLTESSNKTISSDNIPSNSTFAQSSMNSDKLFDTMDNAGICDINSSSQDDTLVNCENIPPAGLDKSGVNSQRLTNALGNSEYPSKRIQIHHCEIIPPMQSPLDIHVNKKQSFSKDFNLNDDGSECTNKKKKTKDIIQAVVNNQAVLLEWYSDTLNLDDSKNINVMYSLTNLKSHMGISSSGYILFGPGQEISQVPRKHVITFKIEKGKALVTQQFISKVMEVHALFYIPLGSPYKIKNLSDSENLILFFTKMSQL